METTRESNRRLLGISLFAVIAVVGFLLMLLAPDALIRALGVGLFVLGLIQVAWRWRLLVLKRR